MLPASSRTGAVTVISELTGPLEIPDSTVLPDGMVSPVLRLADAVSVRFRANILSGVPAGTSIPVISTGCGSMVPAASVEPTGIVNPAGRIVPLGMTGPDGGVISAVVVQFVDKVKATEVVTAIEIGTLAAIALASMVTS